MLPRSCGFELEPHPGAASRSGPRQFFRDVFLRDVLERTEFGLAVSAFFKGGSFPVSIQPVLPLSRGFEAGRLPTRTRKNVSIPSPSRFSANPPELDASHRHAELFYLQKQIQSQTPMVIVLEDGERIDGCIDWYDRNSIKVRGRSKTLIYKSAIKYMYKLGDNG
jgi:sRNA-binding regulator protein Hfq